MVIDEVAQLSSVENVLIVEDHRDAIEVLKQVVSATFEQASVQTAVTLAGGLKILKSSRFDIALLDIGLPDGSGIDLVRYINAEHPETISVVTTIFDDETHLFEALRSGACGYLLKGYSPDELQKYLIDAVSGRPALSPRIARSMLGYFRGEMQSDASSGYPEKLTEREMDVLRLIAKGCYVKEVSRLLGISVNTVSHHVKNLYSKLNVHNRAEATAAAVQLNIFQPR